MREKIAHVKMGKKGGGGGIKREVSKRETGKCRCLATIKNEAKLQ